MTMHAAAIRIKNEPFVLLPRQEYEALLAKAHGQALPDLPAPDRHGHRPARSSVAVLIAREIITARLKAGWTQKQLAQRAKVSVETISRLESARHKPQAATLAKLEAVFKKAGV